MNINNNKSSTLNLYRDFYENDLFPNSNINKPAFNYNKLNNDKISNSNNSNRNNVNCENFYNQTLLDNFCPSISLMTLPNLLPKNIVAFTTLELKPCTTSLPSIHSVFDLNQDLSATACQKS